MNYATIKYNDIANGTGVRTSIFVSGCRNNCPGCFNKEAQNFNYGLEFTEEVEDEIINSFDENYYEGLSILGGEPLEPENAPTILKFINRFKERFPKATIWLYSGYTYEFIDGLLNMDSRKILIESVDIFVDGRFIESEKDITLKFRGSRNQRLIDMKNTIKEGKVVLLED